MKKKVLLLQESIVSYRVPIYEIIAQHVDLTVAYTIKNECKTTVSFNINKLNYRKFKGLVFIKNGFFKLCSFYDIVIFMPDPHYISYCLLPFIFRKYKVIPWSIGFRASYTRQYDVNRKKDLIDKIFEKILLKSDAVIFYMKEPLNFWRNQKIESKTFIAHNTVEVLANKMYENQVKNRILFVGTLYKEKGIYELLDSYIEAKSKCEANDFPLLDIIGKGNELDNIKKIVSDRKLSDFILIHGAIYDEKELVKYFSNAIICVSPYQAGLSVLKSMGYGVPFITRANAITGGERLNIINGENGILYNTKEELVSILTDAYHYPANYLKMGTKAHSYYVSTTTINHMAQGVLDSITFVLAQ